MYYAELLPRLNTLTVILDFPGGVKDIVGIRIDNNDLAISTKSSTLRIKLPIDENHKVADMTISSLKCIDLSLRLSISFPAAKLSEHTQSFMDFNHSNVQKWSCSDLRRTPQNAEKQNIFHFSCMYCNNSIINSKDCSFFDMPSELWSEMMDFWHCHKPHDHGIHGEHQHNHYEELKPKQMDVIIGGFYFLVDKAGGLTVAEDQVYCPSCNAELGVLDKSSKKVFKYNLTLNYDQVLEQFPRYLYVYNCVLDKINLSACRAFVIKSDSKALFIWVLNIGLDISTEIGVFKNALKLLYDVDHPETEMPTEEIAVPGVVLDDCITRLQLINSQLPSGHRSAAVAGKDLSISFMAGA